MTSRHSSGRARLAAVLFNLVVVLSLLASSIPLRSSASSASSNAEAESHRASLSPTGDGDFVLPAVPDTGLSMAGTSAVLTGTAVVTPTLAVTSTRTATAVVPTPSPSVAPTEPLTPTVTAPVTPTIPPTDVSPATPSVTVTPTPTMPPTDTPTATPSLSLTLPVTPVPTTTPSPTPTVTPFQVSALSFSMVVAPEVAAPGEVVTFTLIVNNDGPVVAQGLVASDSLPKGLDYVVGSSSEAEYDPPTGTLVWQMPDLEAGETRSLPFAVRVTAPPAGEVSNTATLTGPGLSVPLTATIPVFVGEPNLVLPETGGTIHSTDGRVKVVFPPGAVSTLTEVSQRPLAPLDLPPDRHLFYRFEVTAREAGRPSVAVDAFALPITVTVTYSDAEVQGLLEEELRLVSWDEKVGAWVPITTTVDMANKRLTAQLSHFSVYAIEGEEDVLFLSRIEAGQVSLFSGDSSFSYDLEVPAGAGGLKVPLTLRYNGGIPNGMIGGENTDTGWVGVGWTLEIGQIEKERLILNGQSWDLAAVGLDGTPTPGTNVCGWDGSRCHDGLWYWREWRTKDEAFARIESNLFYTYESLPPEERLVAQGQWDVWTKDGTHYVFGSQQFVPTNPALPENGGTGSRLYVTANNWRRVYETYKLDTIEDTHGNQIRIEWNVHPMENGRFHLKESYPSYIHYTTNTGAGDNHEEYDIEFIVTGKGFDRQDSKRIAETAYKLDAINVWYQADSQSPKQLVRRYNFGYEVYPDDRIQLQSITQCADVACSQALPATTFSYYYDTNHEIGWKTTNDGWSHRARRPFLQTVDNGYGGSITFQYQAWCMPEGHVCGKDVGWGMRQRATTQVLAPGIGPPTSSSYAYAEPACTTISEPFTTWEKFIGFGRVTEELAAGNRRTVTLFDNTLDGGGQGQGHPEDPYKGKVVETRVEDLAGTLYARTTTAYADGREADWPETVHFLYPSEVVEYTCQFEGLCQSKRSEYYYQPERQGGQQYGNPTEIREYDASDTLYRTTRRWYNTRNDAQAYIVDRVSAEAVYEGDGWVEKSATWYYYDNLTSHQQQVGTKGELWAVQAMQNRAEDSSYVYWDAAETRFSYDGHGNQTAASEYAGPAHMKVAKSNWVAYRNGGPTEARTTTTVYDPQGVFATRVTNDKGQSIWTQYYGVDGVAADYGLPGQVKKVTDPNGVWAEYRYDSFGRLTRQKRSGDGAGWEIGDVSLYRGYYSVGTAGLQHVTTWLGRNDHWEEVFFDGLGRTIQTHRLKEGSTEIRTTTSYNTVGQVEKEWVPYEGAHGENGGYGAYGYVPPAPGLPYSSSQYDALGRVTVVVNPDDTRTEHHYGIWYDTDLDKNVFYDDVLDANLHRKQSRYDVMGRLVKVDEIGGNCGNYWGYSCGPGDTQWYVYALTLYTYDVQDNLLTVKDAADNVTRMTYDMLGRKLTMDDPNMGDWSYAYDALGNLTVQDDAKHQRLCSYYDDLNRLEGKYYTSDTVACPASPTYAVGYYYDGETCGDCSTPTGKVVGQRTAMGDASGWTVYSFDDDRGHLTEERKYISGGGTFNTSYTYDAMDRVTTMTYPGGSGGQSGEQVTTTYNTQGLPKTLINDSSYTYVQDTTYNALGQVELRKLGSTPVLTTTYSYRADNHRLEWIRTGPTSPFEGLQKLHYVYDNVGNVLSITDYDAGGTQTQSFTYDDLDRLVTAQASGGTGGTYSQETYAYSGNSGKIGNLTSKAGVAYTYQDAAHKHAVTHLNGVQKYWYDANGNMTTRKVGSDTYTQIWDYENRLTEVKKNGVTVTTLVYDGDGNRVKGMASGVTKAYVGDYFEWTGSTTTMRKYYYAGDQRVAMREGSSTVYWLLGDHLGSTAITASSSGSKVGELRYKAWGETRYSSGTTPTSFRYTGQRVVGYIELYQMGARWYDPELGRFLSPDTIAPSPQNPQSFNRFSYVLGNPLKFVDPTGHKEEGACGPNDTCREPDIPDWLAAMLADPEVLAWLAEQVDSWLWDNVPSAVGIYGDVSGSLGLVAEGELNAEVSLMFNWRSGELTFLYGPGVGAYLGTPRGASISGGAGGKWTYGASRNEFLKGVDVYYGVTGGVDAFGEVEAELTGSSSLDYVDVNGNGKLDLHDDLTFFTDPNSGRHVNSLQVGLGAGVNPVPNGFEGGARAGLSVTAGFNIISGWDWKGWPWNW
jgi:RHS repeat-associated protein/uncharacterized repeat protein (TIGR01451 family)